MNQPKSIEITAPDIESAIAKGVAELGVSRDEVMVEVIEEPGRRLLGLGTRHARVRLTVIRAPSTPVPEVPKSESSGQGERGEHGPRAERSGPRTGRPRPQTRRTERPAPPPREVDEEAQDEAPAISYEDEDEERVVAEVNVADLAEEARIGSDVLKTLLNKMGIQAQVVTQPSKTDGNEAQHWTLEIRGKDLGMLIGRRGETLAAIQYITRLITSRQIGHRANLVVDVEGYKSRREAMLQRLAQRMAEQAVQRGRTVSMEPMPPHERRIIHLTLRNHPDVTTESIGEGDRRKVTVIPRREK